MLIVIGSIFSAVMIGVAFVINRKEQPKQLWLLFFTEMWERFSFYGMRALLILYMTHILLFPDKDANLQYGAYNALVYTMPLLGGWLADRILGFRKSIVLGGLMMAIGHLVLAIPSSTTFFLGLGFLISGNGFFKPNISSFLSQYYEKDDPRKDAGYSIFYMGVNIGAFLGSTICGFLGQKGGLLLHHLTDQGSFIAPLAYKIATTFGSLEGETWHKECWHLGFGVAGFFMIVGVINFLLFRRILGDKGHSPDPVRLASKVGGVISLEWLLYIGAFLLVPLMLGLVKYHGIMSVLLYPLGIAALVYVVYESFKFDQDMRRKLWAACILTVSTIIFWGFYEQSGGSLNLMAERNVDMHVFGHELPSASVNNATNPFYIIFLTPLFAAMWTFLTRRNIEPNTPVKFGLAFLFVGAGYFTFYLGGQVGQATGFMPIAYFLLAYLIITTGELFLSPIGLSMITKLSPTQMVGFMMGMWFLATAFGQHLAGLIGSHMDVPHGANGAMATALESLPVYMNGCMWIGIVSVAGGVILLAFSPVIKKLMGDVH